MRSKTGLILAAAAALAGCAGPSGVAPAMQAGLHLDPAVQVGDTAHKPADPYLQLGPDGKVHLSWTETAPGTDGRNAFVAALTPQGELDGTAQRINGQDGEISGHGGENLPRFAFGPGGSLTSAWMMPLGQTHTGVVRTSHASDGRAFAPARTVNDDGKEINHAFSSMAATPNGSLFLAWIDGRERTDPKDDRQTIYMATSTDGGATFGPNYRVGTAACACCRTTTLALDGGKTILIAYRSVSKPDNVRNHVVVRSTDGGKSFSAPTVVSDDGWATPGCPHAGIGMTAGPDGRVHAAWWTGGRTPAEAGIYYTYSDDQGRSFAPRELVAPASADSVLHAQVAADEQGRLFLAWEAALDGKNQILLTYREKGQKAWSKPVQLSEGEMGAAFPAIVATGERVYAAWTVTDGEESQVMVRSIHVPAAPAPKLGVIRQGTPAAGGQAPDFALKSMEGQVVRLSDFRGKPVVLNMFASWCDPCREEAPTLQALHADQAGSGLVVLGVAIRDDRESLAPFLKSGQISFPVLLDTGSSVERAYKVVGPPATFLIDGSGKVLTALYGPVDRERLDAELARLDRSASKAD